MRGGLPFQVFHHAGRFFGRFSGRGWSMRLAVLLIIAAIISGFATYAALTATPPFGDDPDSVVWLLNLNLVILLMLAMLIGRRVAKIWAGRRQGIAGSKLHVRLVLIFSLMAAAPAIMMAIFSAFFFHYGVQSWFSDRVQTAVVESQAVAEAYLEEHQQVIRADLLAMAGDVDRQAGLYLESRSGFERMLETQAYLRNLTEVMMFQKNGRVIARGGLTFTLSFETLPTYVFDQVSEGEVILMTGETEDRVRAITKLNAFEDTYLFVGRMVDPTVLSHLAATEDAASEYKALQDVYSNLQITVTVIFMVVALLLLLAATWFGIMLARQLVMPIGALVSASDRVRDGDLSARVNMPEGIEEFEYLGNSFNRMTGQIEAQRNELVDANRQMDQRRIFTETVLAGVSSGVIGVDEEGIITITNSTAQDILEQDHGHLVGKNIKSFLPEISDLLKKAKGKPGKIQQAEIPILTEDKHKRTLLVRIGAEKIGSQNHGAVLTFDDITELQSAQRKAAWADVARRIAHEIKNPLTPIQLSAERLHRKYKDEVQTDPDVFTNCTDTIVKHVEDIGRMVSEFSNFARMPEPEMRDEVILKQLRDMIILQREAHKDISFDLKGFEESGFILTCDAQQVRQAMTNLVQNAIDSVHEKISGTGQKGEILILANCDEAREELILSVLDNGMGLPDAEDPSSLLEPYITHKEKGTGLGLAIVKKIMEDHRGALILGATQRLKEYEGWEEKGGASVSLVFPYRQETGRVRTKEAA